MATLQQANTAQLSVIDGSVEALTIHRRSNTALFFHKIAPDANGKGKLILVAMQHLITDPVGTYLLGVDVQTANQILTAIPLVSIHTIPFE